MTDDDLQRVDLTQLPPQVRLLANIMGLPDTIKLLKTHGGQRIRIPMGCRDDSQLLSVISQAAFDALCKSRFAGERLTLPKIDKISDQLRNLHMKAVKGQVSKSELARAYDLSIRHVQRIWNEDDENNPTLDMFDDAV